MIHPLTGADPRPSADICFGLGRRWRDAGFEIADLEPELPEEQVEPHHHDNAHFVLVLDGLYLSSAAGAPGLSSGSLLVYNPPGTVHRDRFRGGGRFLALGLPPEALVMADGLPDIPTVFRGASFQAALGLAAAVTAGEADVAGLCWDLVAASGGPAGRVGRPGWLIRARAIIDGLRGDVRLADVAREAGVHPVHLARQFRQAYGVSPVDYRGFQRISHARELLRNTDLPLVEIALRTGFADQSHLTKMFSKRFGIAPRAFRAAIGEVANGQDSGGSDVEGRATMS